MYGGGWVQPSWAKRFSMAICFGVCAAQRVLLRSGVLVRTRLASKKRRHEEDFLQQADAKPDDIQERLGAAKVPANRRGSCRLSRRHRLRVCRQNSEQYARHFVSSPRGFPVLCCERAEEA